MDELRQYGVAVMPLGRLVRNFSLEQGNMKSAMFLKNLKHAEWVWKEIFRETLWSIKTQAVKMHNRTITLPDDCERLINISVVDCFGKLHPLTFDSDLNTAKIKCVHNACSCSKCNGEDTLCASLDNITMTTETIEIQGEDYTQTTWVRHAGGGDIQKVVTTPMLNATTNEVEYITTRSTVCNVEVDSKGCIKATQPNVDLLIKYCGCGTGAFNNGIGVFGWGNSVYGALIPPVYNYWGYYNINAQDPNIVHIFRNDRNKSEDSLSWGQIGTILVSYQTNGIIPGQEVLIPEYAYDAMTQGIIYRQRKLNVRDGDKDGSFYNMFRREKQRIFRYLNPVNMEQIEKLHTQARKW
jgi:hypothetical protein